MKKFSHKTKIIITAVSSILVLTCVVGVTLALLRNKSEPVTNKFKGAAVNIGVVEGGKIYEDGENTVTYPDVQGGQVVEKIVAVQNITSDEYPTTDTWVRARLVPIIRYNDDAKENAGQVAPVTVDPAKLTYTMGDSRWIQDPANPAGDQKLEVYYYYNEAVKPGNETGNLITGVKYTGTVPADAHFELQVLTEGISAKQDGAVKDAWGQAIAEKLGIK